LESFRGRGRPAVGIVARLGDRATTRLWVEDVFLTFSAELTWLLKWLILWHGASLGDFRMHCTAGRWILFAACLAFTACGGTSSGQKADAASDRGSLSNAQPATESGAANRLSARIELGSQTPGPKIFYDSPVRVVLTNNTDRPIRIWNPQTKNGYRQFSFRFAIPKSGKERIARRRDVQDDSFWKSLARRIKSGSEVIEIAANGEMPLEFVLSEFAWGERAWVGLASPNSDEPYSVSVQFANAEGSHQQVWTGAIQSDPIVAQFVADSLKTPHNYLWNGFAEKAIEMMEADPKWIAARDDEDQCTPLHYAARFGPLLTVEWLLDHGADVNAVAYNQFTPLHLADDPAIVRLILEKQPDLTLRDASGVTAPQRAASELTDARSEKDRDQWRQIVKLYEDATGGADLFTAATVGDLDGVKAILSKSPEFADDFQGRSPLRIAASRGHFKICQYLLEGYRVDVNDFERGVGYPIIKEAVAYPRIVRLLIDHGADLKTRITWQGGRSGVWIIGDDATALHYAADTGVPETIKLLIDSGVDIFATAHDLADKNDKQTALEVAAIFGKADNAQAIVSHPKFDMADPQMRQAILNKCLRLGAFPSWLARDADRPKLMEVLLRKGANPNASEDGVTAIQLAARAIHPTQEKEYEAIKRTIAVLKEHGAKLDLFSAVAIGDEAQVQSLLASDRRLANVRGPDGYPALHLAVSMNYKNIVSALLKADGDVNIRNESEDTGSVGDTALDWADFWDRDEIAKLLIDSGGKRRAD
jgi:ankyrin repeat protein